MQAERRRLQGRLSLLQHLRGSRGGGGQGRVRDRRCQVEGRRRGSRDGRLYAAEWRWLRAGSLDLLAALTSDAPLMAPKRSRQAVARYSMRSRPRAVHFLMEAYPAFAK